MTLTIQSLGLITLTFEVIVRVTMQSLGLITLTLEVIVRVINPNDVIVRVNYPNVYNNR